MDKVHFSSNSNEWSTPQDFFNELDNIFHFTLDPCSTHDNAKCKKHYTIEDDGLSKSWRGEVVFCNPPYGRELPKWIKKCHFESVFANVVMLIPARTDTKAFHQYICEKHDIMFIQGRLKFGGSKTPAPFPSMLVVMRPSDRMKYGWKIYE